MTDPFERQERNMPVQMVRNNQAGPTVLSSDPKGTEYVEWLGKGDPNGEDIQPVSELIQGLAQFHKMLRRGVLELVTEEEAEQAFDRQKDSWDQRQGATRQVAEQAIEQTANNDLIVFPCVGPGSRPGEKCGHDVTVRDITKYEKPPLCNLHEDLASQYIPQESEEIRDGKHTVTWTRLTMGARERQQ